MAIIPEKDTEALRDMFNQVLVAPVKMVFFKSASCEYCQDEETLLSEVAALSDKVTIVVKDLDQDSEEAKSLGVEYAPGLVLLAGENKTGVVFTGGPFGYEFSSLIEAIKMISVGDTGLSDDVKKKVKAIAVPAKIRVFVTPSCPYCPRAVITAHQFALENPLIIGEMVEAQEFPEMSQLYSVYAVPKVVINEKTEFEGALPEKQFLEYLLEATAG